MATRTEVAKRSGNPIDAHVGARMRLRRMLIGMSQETLGDRIGVTFQQVQKYENGANRMGASRLFEVSRVLGLPVQYFFEDLPGKGAKPIARPQVNAGDGETFIMDFVNSSEGLGLNRAYIKIKNPKVRRRILELVRDIAADEDT